LLQLNGFGMLRGNVPLDRMVTALPHGPKQIARALGRHLVPTIEYEPLFMRSSALRFVQALAGVAEADTAALAVVHTVAAVGGPAAGGGGGPPCRTQCRVVYVGGADSLGGIEQVLADGCAAVQLGRPLIREPFFVRRMKLAAEAWRREGVSGKGEGEGEGAVGAGGQAQAQAQAGGAGRSSQGGAGRSSQRELPSVESKCIRCNFCTLASIDPVLFPAGCHLLKPGEGVDIEDAHPRM
jgi:hypothetical protein